MLKDLAMLEKNEILSKIKPDRLSKLDTLELYDTLASTNDYLMEKAREIVTDHLKTIACLAETQTHGRGEHGRTWVSPHGRNLYLSLLWHFPKDVMDLTGLSLAIAVAITRGLKHFGVGEGLSLKWPNDVFYNNRKLAGILIELRPQSLGMCNAVIGVGLNIHMPEKDSLLIDQPWIDLHTILGRSIDRNQVAGVMLDELIEAASTFKASGFSDFMPDWQALDQHFEKELSFVTGTQTIQGIGQGINSVGQYLVKTENGIQAFSSGKGSIKKP